MKYNIKTHPAEGWNFPREGDCTTSRSSWIFLVREIELSREGILRIYIALKIDGISSRLRYPIMNRLTVGYKLGRLSNVFLCA